MPIPVHHERPQIPPAYFEAFHAARQAYAKPYSGKPGAQLRCSHAGHAALGTPKWMEEQGEEVSSRLDEYFSALNCFLDQVEQGPITSTPTPYENCCEAAFETLKKDGKEHVPDVPNWTEAELEWYRKVQEAHDNGLRNANQATAYKEIVRKKAINYLIITLHKPFEGLNGVGVPPRNPQAEGGNQLAYEPIARENPRQYRQPLALQMFNGSMTRRMHPLAFCLTPYPNDMYPPHSDLEHYVADDGTLRRRFPPSDTHGSDKTSPEDGLYK